MTAARCDHSRFVSRIPQVMRSRATLPPPPSSHRSLIPRGVLRRFICTLSGARMLFPTDIRFIVDVWRLLLLPDASRWRHRKRLLEKEERSISRHRLSLSLSLSLYACVSSFFCFLFAFLSYSFSLYASPSSRRRVTFNPRFPTLSSGSRADNARMLSRYRQLRGPTVTRRVFGPGQPPSSNGV